MIKTPLPHKSISISYFSFHPSIIDAHFKNSLIDSVFRLQHHLLKNQIHLNVLHFVAGNAQDQLLTSYHIDSDAKSDYPGMFVVMPLPNNNNNDNDDDDDNNNNNNNNVEPTENDISSLQHDGLRLVVPPNVGSLIIDNSQMNQELDVTVQMNTPGNHMMVFASNLFSKR